MNKVAITILTIIVLSIAAFCLMYYLTDFGLKKSLIISVGAAVAMILFDVVILNLVRKR
jgi:low affinity Fe/Cu permease